MTRFEEINTWQQARDLSRAIYQHSAEAPFVHDFALKNQIRRASGSIMDNIAEGFARNGNREFIQHLSIAKASAAEVQSQLYRALDNQYITQNQFDQLYQQANQIAAMLTNLMKYLINSPRKGLKYE